MFSYGPEQKPVTAFGQPALTTVPPGRMSAATAVATTGADPARS
ncbi:hypothetical protein [Cryobacterium aureum]|nr:hypothetical protein [Cryobacterium aureum]